MKIFGYEIKKASIDEKAGSVVSPYWVDGMTHLSSINPETLVNAYKSWIYVCANKNSTSVAQQVLKLYSAKPSKESKILAPHKAVSRERKQYLNGLSSIQSLKSVRASNEIIEITEHPFIDLLTLTNPFMGGFDLFEMTTLYQELIGNAYWYIVKDEFLNIPVELWVIPAQRMSAVPSKESGISGYIYTNGTIKIPFEPEEILHFKYPNPKDFYNGVSPLLAISDSYNTNENILNFTNSLFTNMARPEGVLYTDQSLAEPDFKILKDQWNAAYGGASKARKTAVLTKGLKYEPITMTPQELDYVEGRKVVKEEICNAYGQSLALYSEKSNRANSEQAYLSFLRDTIQPRLRRIEGSINRHLMPMYDQTLFVAFDNPVPEDKEYRLKEKETNISTGYSSINQERERDGKEPVEWGDIPIMPQNMYPLGTAPSSSGSTPDKEGDDGDDTKFIIRQLLQRIKSA
jgi:HK97 family phage portal protein